MLKCTKKQTNIFQNCLLDTTCLPKDIVLDIETFLVIPNNTVFRMTPRHPYYFVSNELYAVESSKWTIYEGPRYSLRSVKTMATSNPWTIRVHFPIEFSGTCFYTYQCSQENTNLTLLTPCNSYHEYQSNV